MSFSEYETLSIKQEEMDYLLEKTNHKYSDDIFLIVHVALMTIPWLKESGLFKQVSVTHPGFRIQTREIALAIRIITMFRYGLMHKSVLQGSGLKTSWDLNCMLMTMYQIRDRDSMSILKKWDIEDFNYPKVFSTSDPILAHDIFNEVVVCEKLLHLMTKRQFFPFSRFPLETLKKDTKKTPLELSIEIAKEMGFESIPFQIDINKREKSIYEQIIDGIIEQFRKKNYDNDDEQFLG